LGHDGDNKGKGGRAVDRTPASYDEDLAYIHDVGFNFFALGAAPGLLAILRRAGLKDCTIVDLGCGTGLWARELSRAGYVVHGIDYSPSMLRIARRRVPGGTFQQGSVLQAHVPCCDAVTATGEVLNYQFDPACSWKKLCDLFRRVHDALNPGGLFAFDFAEPGRGGGPGRRQKHFQGPDWALLLETEEDEPAQRLTRWITTFRKVGRSYRRAEEVHRLQLYRGGEVLAALRHLGFRARLVRGYGSFRFPLKIAAVIARK
jgi:SAM-dependent methyltransferase